MGLCCQLLLQPLPFGLRLLNGLAFFDALFAQRLNLLLLFGQPSLIFAQLQRGVALDRRMLARAAQRARLLGFQARAPGRQIGDMLLQLANLFDIGQRRFFAREGGAQRLQRFVILLQRLFQRGKALLTRGEMLLQRRPLRGEHRQLLTQRAARLALRQAGLQRLRRMALL